MNVSKSSTDVNDDSLPLPLVIVLVIPAIVIITLTILGNLLVLRFKVNNILQKIILVYLFSGSSWTNEYHATCMEPRSH